MIELKKINVGNLEFDCRVSGNESDECVILLHGFPETSIMWSDLMDYLASSGYYCIAPDLRGYSNNARPRGVSEYTIDKLTNDVTNIANEFNVKYFHLIGHDWGAVIGWNTVFQNPERIMSWSALSVPHSQAFQRAFKTDKEQKKKSRYIGWFLLPILPEIFIKWNDFAAFKKLWSKSSPEEVEHYLSVFRRKYALTAILNYYKANIGKGKGQHLGDIETPTLFIWGKNDVAIGSTAANSNARYMKGAYKFLELDGGHWLIQTNFQEVATAVGEHLSKNKSTSSG